MFTVVNTSQSIWCREATPKVPCRIQGLCHTVTPELLRYSRRYCNIAPCRDAFCISNLCNTSNSRTLVPHCATRETARPCRPWSWPIEGGLGLLPIALSDVVTHHHGGKVIQSVPVWNVRVTLFCVGSIGALRNIHRSMRWQLFFHLFLDRNGDISVPPGQRFERRPHCLANSLSPRQKTHSLGSLNSHNDDSYMDLRVL